MITRLDRAATVLLLTVLACTLPACGGTDIFAPTPTPVPVFGKIAYFHDEDGFSGVYDVYANWEIYVMDADGSNKRNLTNFRYSDLHPVWSPDGTKIAFCSSRDSIYWSDTQTYRIYVMDADGSNQTRLIDIFGVYPTWSPDGKVIAFCSVGEDADIYAVDLDGSNLVNISNNPAWDRHPSWSPDGSRIAFCTDRTGSFQICVMDADGSNQVVITDLGLMSDYPKWSPDSSKIVFHVKVGGSDEDGYDYEIYTMNADGSNPVNLTNSPYMDWLPSFSPDGNWIAFSSNRDGNHEIYIMDINGSNLVRLTETGAAFDDFVTSWTP